MDAPHIAYSKPPKRLTYLVLQDLRQVPMVEGDQGLDALLLERGDEVLVVGDSLRVLCPGAARDDPGGAIQ